MEYLRARFETKPRKYSNAGTTEKTIYTVEYDIDGTKKLKEAGVENTYEKIQAAAAGTDINNLIERAKRGDPSVTRANKIYGDFTEMPQDMRDFMNIKLKAEQAWETLPIEIRRSYDHDIEKYMMDIGSERWMDLHGLTKKEEPIKEEVKAE